MSSLLMSLYLSTRCTELVQQSILGTSLICQQLLAQRYRCYVNTLIRCCWLSPEPPAVAHLRYLRIAQVFQFYFFLRTRAQQQPIMRTAKCPGGVLFGEPTHTHGCSHVPVSVFFGPLYFVRLSDGTISSHCLLQMMK